MPQNNPYLSIIIPAYNEEKRIGDSLDKILKFLAGFDYTFEIIVVDDGSSDGTSDIVNKYGNNIHLISQPGNMGKGAAVRAGMLAAKGELRVFSDADLSTPIHELNKVIPIINEGYDIFIGSRALDYSSIKEHQPFYREFMGKTFNKIVQALVIKGIKDTQCGFKAFTKEASETVFRQAKIDGFGFDVEILYLANKAGLKAKEVSVEWYNDERSKVNPVTDSLKMFLELLKIKRLHNK